jgi:hypothetical protein
VTSSACALAEARKSKIQLTGCRGTRTPKRPARHIFDGIDRLPRGNHDWVPAIGKPLHSHCPNAVQHVQAPDHGSDGRKSHRKQGKNRQQFPHEICLQRDERCEEHPHPLSAFVVALHLSSVAHPLSLNPRSQIMFRKLRLFLLTHLDASPCPEGLTHSPAPVPFDTSRARKAMVRKSHFALQTSRLVPHPSVLKFSKQIKTNGLTNNRLSP